MLSNDIEELIFPHFLFPTLYIAGTNHITSQKRFYGSSTSICLHPQSVGSDDFAGSARYFRSVKDEDTLNTKYLNCFSIFNHFKLLFLDMKKQVEWLASQSESPRRAAILEHNKEFAVD
ncbi:hypothetical protein ACSQ67_005675 [Phaseolus vulgaris]